MLLNHRPPLQLLSRVDKTTTALERARGLLGRPALAEGQGLLITPCNSVHTFFMRFAIDVVFINRNNTVVKVMHRLRPFRVAIAARSCMVLEIPPGVAARAAIHKGDNLIWLVNQ